MALEKEQRISGSEKLIAALEIMKRTYGQLPRFIRVSVEDYREYREHMGSSPDNFLAKGCGQIHYESSIVEVHIDDTEKLRKNSSELNSLKESLSTIKEILK